VEALQWTDPSPKEDIELVLQLTETKDRVYSGKLAILYFLHDEYEVNVNSCRAGRHIMLTFRRQRSHERGSSGVSVSHSRITSGQEVCKNSPRTSHSFGVFLSPGPGLIASFDRWRSGFRGFTCQNSRLSAFDSLYCLPTDHSRIVSEWRMYGGLPPLLTICLHGIVRISFFFV
jgi:hypothetical protein